MALFTKEEALAYHEVPRPGKLEVLPVKPCFTQKDLSLAYSPGVAADSDSYIERRCSRAISLSIAFIRPSDHPSTIDVRRTSFC